MRSATLLLLAVAACGDLRGFEGTWSGSRVGDSPTVRVGASADATAHLVIDDVDRHGLRGHLIVDDAGGLTGPLVDSPLVSVDGAEADVLATMSFTGAPLRVYLGFVPVTDLLGDATVFVSLYDSGRVEVRMLRGGPHGDPSRTTPIYAIFALSQE